MARQNRKRLSIDIPTEMHDNLKKVAHRHYSTLTMYVLKVLRERISREKDLGNLDEKNDQTEDIK